MLSDFPAQEAFCWWFVQQCVGPSFVLSVLFTEKAGFNRDSKISFHNNHLWAEKSPHNVVQFGPQQHLSVSVWASVVGDYMVGPHDLPHSFIGNEY
jgi:hypothetical protein